MLSANEHDSIGIRVAGYAGANDACHVTGPDYEGLGIGLAAKRAVAHAGLQMSDIDLLHLHATGEALDALFVRLSNADCGAIAAAIKADASLRAAVLNSEASGMIDTYLLSVAAA